MSFMVLHFLEYIIWQSTIFFQQFVHFGDTFYNQEQETCKQNLALMTNLLGFLLQEHQMELVSNFVINSLKKDSTLF